MSDLADKHCIPCKGGVPALQAGEQAKLREQLHDDWCVVEESTHRSVLTCPVVA